MHWTLYSSNDRIPLFAVCRQSNPNRNHLVLTELSALPDVTHLNNLHMQLLKQAQPPPIASPDTGRNLPGRNNPSRKAVKVMVQKGPPSPLRPSFLLLHQRQWSWFRSPFLPFPFPTPKPVPSRCEVIMKTSHFRTRPCQPGHDATCGALL